ncbi:transducin (beta)-like 1 [Nematocida sp. AWRm77]|nr:transducin (beta)-like 1 [Nematocida sp. AWRm77]
MITLTSTELNYLVFRYLIEEGYTHSAYVFGRESMVEDNPGVPQVHHDGLKRYVTKGIEMEYIEKHTDERDGIRKCMSNYSITHPHKCIDQTLELVPTYLQTQNSHVSLCAWSETGELVTGAQNYTLSLWAPPALRREWTLGIKEGTSHGITGLAIDAYSALGQTSPSTAIVGTTHTGDLFVHKDSKEWREQRAHKGAIVAIALQKNSFLTGGKDGVCKEWVIEKSKLVETQKWPMHKGLVMDILPMETGFVTCSVDKTLCTVDSGLITRMYGHTEEVNTIKRVGQTIVSASDDCTIKLWKYGVPTAIGTLEGHAKEVYTLDIFDGTIASGSFDSDVCLWSAEKKEHIRTLKGHKKAVYTVAFSKDGTVLASGGLDSSVCLWDIRSKELAKEFNIGSGIYQVAFSPKSTTLAVCSSNPCPIILDLRR